MSDVIELNDAGIVLGNADGIQLVSPGVAVVDGDTLQVGDDARARSRLDPRKTFDKFWDQLDQQPLNRSAGTAGTHADIAWFHLSDIAKRLGKGDPVILAAPQHFGSERLSLALGIAQACGLNVTGLVESNVAMAAYVAGTGTRLVLDISRHHSHATTVEADGELSIIGSEEAGKGGVSHAHQLWMNFIAAEFLRETRFDPLHDAASEQRLYDNLEKWIHALTENSAVRMEFQAGQRQHRIEISRDQIVQAATAVYEPLIDSARRAGGTVLASARVCALPGLLEKLQQHASVVALPDNALTEAVLAFRHEIHSDSESLAWVTRLPGPMPGAHPLGADGSVLDNAPATHILKGTRAWPFKQAPVLLGGKIRNLEIGESVHGTVVRWENNAAVLDTPEALPVILNGKTVSGRHTLRAGDALHLTQDGDVLRLITVTGS